MLGAEISTYFHTSD